MKIAEISDDQIQELADRLLPFIIEKIQKKKPNFNMSSLEAEEFLLKNPSGNIICQSDFNDTGELISYSYDELANNRYYYSEEKWAVLE